MKHFFGSSATSIYDSNYWKDFKVHIHYTGEVYWMYGGNFATRCELDLTYFPFDKQFCEIIIENWAYTKEQVSFIFIKVKLSYHGITILVIY